MVLGGTSIYHFGGDTLVSPQIGYELLPVTVESVLHSFRIASTCSISSLSRANADLPALRISSGFSRIFIMFCYTNVFNIKPDSNIICFSRAGRFEIIPINAFRSFISVITLAASVFFDVTKSTKKSLTPFSWSKVILLSTSIDLTPPMLL